uniref:Uncharacterized protein n=1 Tax=Arundo donax TaxID=35708 RepID=A0A0A9GA24_ARUDO
MTFFVRWWWSLLTTTMSNLSKAK